MQNWLKKFAGARGDDGYPPKQQWQKILWLAGAIVLGVALILLGNSNGRPSRDVPKKTPAEIREQKDDFRPVMVWEEEILAERLKKMLSQVEGAGRVDVSIRLASSKRGKYAINTTTGRKTTEEKDQAGGTRHIIENTGNEQIVLLREGQKEIPVVEEEQAARIAGVLVVAEGARNPQTKANLFQAVQVALGIEPQKIYVLPAERGE